MYQLLLKKLVLLSSTGKARLFHFHFAVIKYEFVRTIKFAKEDVNKALPYTVRKGQGNSVPLCFGFKQNIHAYLRKSLCIFRWNPNHNSIFTEFLHIFISVGPSKKLAIPEAESSICSLWFDDPTVHRWWNNSFCVKILVWVRLTIPALYFLTL
jgi:hypothetical protein